ncbi:MAG TPA: helix-turn-helix domain-containing protein [Magnetospirillaceae bacterium]
MRAAILDASLTIAAKDGWTAVTMRRIAEHIEYSPATLYAYFPAKQDLLAVLARLAFATLGDRLARVQDPSPERRLRLMTALIWDFARTDRPLYELMVTETDSDRPVPPEAMAVMGQLRDGIAPIAGAARNDLDDLTDMLWASITGLIAQTRLGRIAGGGPRAHHLFDRLVGAQIATWRLRS